MNGDKIKIGSHAQRSTILVSNVMTPIHRFADNALGAVGGGGKHGVVCCGIHAPARARFIHEWDEELQ